MTTRYNIAAVLIAICLMEPLCLADEVGPDGKNIPASSWQQPVRGVAVAMILQDSLLNIYIKNSSSAVEYLPRIGDGVRIQAFYIKDDGSKIPLENYNPVIHSATKRLEFTMPSMPNVTSYEPGRMVEKTIELSTNNLTMVTQCPVITRFMYGQIATGKIIFIETAPIKLTAK